MKAIPLVLALALLPAAVTAEPLRFTDPAGDQAPWPAHFDILTVELDDDVRNLTIRMGLQALAPEQGRANYQMVFETETQNHNIGCFTGANLPVEDPSRLDCFAHRWDRSEGPVPETQIHSYSEVLEARVGDDGRSIVWVFPVSAMAEIPGTELRLIQAFSQAVLSAENGEDVFLESTAGNQDEASTDQVYVLPKAWRPWDKDAASPQAAPPAPPEKDIPAPTPALLLVALSVACIGMRRR